MTIAYDAIVVGARCAGSPTAILLARKGFQVLLVDRATFPSDTISTLVINPPGVAALGRWGLLDEVLASGCPPIRSLTMDFGPFVISGSPRPVAGTSVAYAPRRYVLDRVLVDAAAAAGADVREGVSVAGLIRENGAVVGVRGTTITATSSPRAHALSSAPTGGARVSRRRWAQSRTTSAESSRHAITPSSRTCRQSGWRSSLRVRTVSP